MPLRHIVGLVQLHAIAALILRGVAGYIGGAHHTGDGRCLTGDFDDADADTDRRHAVLPDEPIIADGLPQSFGHAQRMIQRAILQQDPELIPAQACQRIADAHSRLQHSRNLFQELIPRRMAAGIVDQLELIEVEIQQRVPATGVGADGVDRCGQPIVELAAIDEPGERVVTRLVMQRPVEAPFLADVVEHHDGAEHVARPVADGSRRVLDGEFLPAAIDEYGVFSQTEGLPLAKTTHDRTLGRLLRRFVDHGQDVADALRLGLPALPAGEALRHRIYVIDAAFGVGGDDRVADRLERDLRALLSLEDLGFRFLAFGDVGDGALESADASFLVAHHAPIVDYHQHGAVFAAQNVLDIAHFAFA